MERWLNRVAVVTGAASGIGETIAKDLVLAGVQVVALDLHFERLEKNRSDLPTNVQKLFFPQKCDVTDKDEVNATFEWIEATLGGTDILVNNAGVFKVGNILEMDLADIDQVINTNVKGVINCTQAAFKSMKARKFDGHIVNLNSISGHQALQILPGVSSNIYPATKHAVTAINETIRLELNNLKMKIKTTSISPGLVRTEINREELVHQIESFLNTDDISQAVLFAISTPPHVQIHEIIVKPVGETF